MLTNHILAASVCFLLFMFGKYGFGRKSQPQPMPEDDIERAFRYHERRIDRMSINDVKRNDSQESIIRIYERYLNNYYGSIKNFEDVFFFNPARDFYAEQLKLMIQMKLNDAWLMETRVLEMN